VASASTTSSGKPRPATCPQVMVNTVRLQVDYPKIIQGDGDVPFVEEPEAKPAPAAEVAASRVFPAGPAEDHAWRTPRVHRLQR